MTDVRLRDAERRALSGSVEEVRQDRLYCPSHPWLAAKALGADGGPLCYRCAAARQAAGEILRSRHSTQAPERKVWGAMIQRCYDRDAASFQWYGAKGVRVCARWLASFEVFLSDVGLRPSPAHSIDRIDPAGHYEPGNVRWATAQEQADNRSTSILVDGGRKSVATLAREAGLRPQTVLRRLKRGWPLEVALDPKAQEKKRASRPSGGRAAPVPHLVSWAPSTAAPQGGPR
jgi:hypothetical protein